MPVVSSVLKLEPSQSLINDTYEKGYYWNVLLDYYKLPHSFKHFPGPNPVSICRDTLETFEAEDFMAALKTDGVRYLFLLTTKPNSTEPIAIMVDRALHMYEIVVWAIEEFFYEGCLFDGELVWDGNGNQEFIIFDVILIRGLSCINMSYSERLCIIRNHILSADEQMNDATLEQLISEEEKLCARNNNYNMQIVPKHCVNKHNISDLWFGRQLCSHRNDGIIITTNNSNIHTGTSKTIFKWKPSHSIDIKAQFLNEIWSFYANENNSDREINISTNIGKYKTLINVDSKLLALLKSKVHCVIECLIEIDDNGVTLTPERERTDKKTANTLHTIERTIHNAKENIVIEDLICACKCVQE